MQPSQESIVSLLRKTHPIPRIEVHRQLCARRSSLGDPHSLQAVGFDKRETQNFTKREITRAGSRALIEHVPGSTKGRKSRTA